LDLVRENDDEIFARNPELYPENSVKRGSVKSSKNSNFDFRTQNEGQATVMTTKIFSDDSHNAISSCDHFYEEFALKGTTGKDAPLDIHWYLDSGCTRHMTNNETIVYDKFPQNVEVSGAVNGPPILGKLARKVKLFPIIDNHVSSITLENVLVVDIRKNLISVKQICAHGGKVEFYEKFAAGITTAILLFGF